MKKLDLFRLSRNLINDKISIYIGWVGLGMILFGAMFTVVSVGLRYTIGVPLPGDVEIPAIMLPVAVAFFYILANVQKRHIRATILVRHLAARRQTLLESFYSFVGALLYAILASQAVVHALGAVSINLVTDILRLPVPPFEFVFAFTMALFSFHLLLEGISLLKVFVKQR